MLAKEHIYIPIGDQAVPRHTHTSEHYPDNIVKLDEQKT